MAARPPFFDGRSGANERVVGAIFPRAVDRFRSRRDDHMAGRRPRGAADGSDHVIIVAVPRDLRSLGREAFDHPVGRIAPRVINMLGLADAPQTIVRQADAVAARRSEEHTSELQSLMRISYAVFCLKKKNSEYTHMKTHKLHEQ